MPIEYRRISGRETERTIDQSRIIAVFVETAGGEYGLMFNGVKYPTRAEKAALIRAARAVIVRDK
jgi:hypothetical protein